MQFDNKSVKILKWLHDGRSLDTRLGNYGIGYNENLDGIFAHNGHGFSSNGYAIKIARNIFDKTMTGLYNFGKVKATQKDYSPKYVNDLGIKGLLEIVDSFSSAKFQKIDVTQFREFVKPFKKTESAFFYNSGDKLTIANNIDDFSESELQIEIMVRTGIPFNDIAIFNTKELYKMLALFKGEAYMAMIDRNGYKLLIIANNELAIGLMGRKK